MVEIGVVGACCMAVVAVPVPGLVEWEMVLVALVTELEAELK